MPPPHYPGPPGSGSSCSTMVQGSQQFPGLEQGGGSVLGIHTPSPALLHRQVTYNVPWQPRNGNEITFVSGFPQVSSDLYAVVNKRSGPVAVQSVQYILDPGPASHPGTHV